MVLMTWSFSCPGSQAQVRDSRIQWAMWPELLPAHFHLRVFQQETRLDHTRSFPSSYSNFINPWALPSLVVQPWFSKFVRRKIFFCSKAAFLCEAVCSTWSWKCSVSFMWLGGNRNRTGTAFTLFFNCQQNSFMLSWFSFAFRVLPYTDTLKDRNYVGSNQKLQKFACHTTSILFVRKPVTFNVTSLGWQRLKTQFGSTSKLSPEI